jgi:predicted permease
VRAPAFLTIAIESLFQDIRYSCRGVRRQPGFFLAAVASLTLAMGVNTAIFSATDALLWRPLPVRDADRTIYIFHSSAANPDQGTSFPAFQAYSSRTDLFADVMAFGGARPLLLGDGERRETVYAEPVTSDYFSIADVALPLGRPFDAGADAVHDPVSTAILSHRAWTRRFGADPSIVGRRIMLNGEPFTVSGVAREHFTGFDAEVSVDFWIPVTTWAHLAAQPARLTSDEHWLTTVATLRDDVTLDQARSALTAMGPPRPATGEQRVGIRPIRERASGQLTDAVVISGAAFLAGAIVLGLAWTNVASLTIARVAARRHEMSVRAALGGSRARLLRLWLVEMALPSGMACVGAVILASWILDAAVAVELPAGIGHPSVGVLPFDFRIDARVLTFVLGLSALSSIVLSLLSGVTVTGAGVLRRGGAWTERRFLPGVNLRSAVLASQLVLSLVLLIPGGLLARSWFAGAGLWPGFSTENVLLVPISSNQSGLRVNKPADFEAQLIASLEGAPDIESMTAMDPVPLWFGGNFAWYSADGGVAEQIGFSRVAPGYFRTLRLPLVLGRDFTTADRASAPPVAIVNETLARRLFPGGNALGRGLRRGKTRMHVVGIAADAKYRSLAEPPQPWIYVPLAQEPTDNPALSLAVRVGRDSAQVRQRIEREVRAIVPAWPPIGFRHLNEGLQLQQMIPRSGATLLGGLGTLALLLATVGIYGVTANVVGARRREMGIRLALGSPAGHVTTLVVAEVMRVCVPAAAAGTVLAIVAAQPIAMAGLLVGTSPADPVALTLVPVTLVGVAVLASYLPAKRAGRLNPLSVLRAE